VVAALALAGGAVLIIGGLLAAARLVHIGNLDAMALAEKLAVPYPVSALDWPELRIRAVVPQPGEPSLVLLHVEWPWQDGQAATLLLQLTCRDPQPVLLLSRWCAAGASVAPSRGGIAEVELRRRQSLERVRGTLLVEDVAQAPVWPAHDGSGS
jgi:hypothetical protein